MAAPPTSSTPVPKPDAAVAPIARETVDFLERRAPTGLSEEPRTERSAGALARLGRLLDAQISSDSPEVIELCARATLETWLLGHALLVLDDEATNLLEERTAARHRDLGTAVGNTSTDDIRGVTLAELAAALDRAMYGVDDPPKAFQRHLRSFSDEIDVGGALGDLGRITQPSAPDRADHVRVSLWVTLFLAHDHHAASGRADDAATARALFDQLRSATDDWYRSRRTARPVPESPTV